MTLRGPDLDPEALIVKRSLHLSDRSELAPRPHLLAIAFGTTRGCLAVTGGVHSGRDALKVVMAGARGVEVVSVLRKHGVGRLRVILDERTRGFEEHEYDKHSTAVGSRSFARCPDSSADERAHDVQLRPSWHGGSGRGGATGAPHSAGPHTGGLTGGCGESGAYSPQTLR